MNMNPNLESHNVHYETRWVIHFQQQMIHVDNCAHIVFLDNIQYEHPVDGLDKDNNYFDSVDNNMLIILNDNQMAIDPIHGGFTQYLIDITTSQTYNRVRYKIYKTLKKFGLISERGKNRIISFNNTVKAALTKQHNIFEGLNIRYFGPVDGHDVDTLVRVLSDIKHFKGPKVLHCITQKGKGYEPAEKSVTEWHAPGKFCVETGERSKSTSDKPTPPLFQDVFGETLLELAKQNE
jgi:1-deoxy-D-xylulose-5-phosphate synthase